MCNVESIDRIAKKNNLTVIYDAAHAFGVKYKGISSSNYGDVSMFSFHATKVFNTIEGGCICFNDDDKVELMNDLKNFGIHGPESVQYIGGNAKMNEFQAAMGICNLRHIDEWIEKRKKIVERYRNELCNVKGIKIMNQQNDVESNYAYFPILFENFKYTRNEIFEILYKENIVTRKYFYPLITDFDCYKNCNFKGSDQLPIAKKLSDEVLTLPLYPDLELEIVDKICSYIKNC